MQKYFVITLAVLLAALLLAGCGGGSSLRGIGDTAAGDTQVGAGDGDVFDKGPGFYEGKGPANGLPQEFGSYYIDEVPDVYLRSQWCNVYGQWYKYGGAELVYGDLGEEGEGWYMHYWLSDEAYGDGWGLYEAHVGYWTSETWPGDKKAGIPGKYQDKWEWDPDDPGYPDTPPQTYDLYLSEYVPGDYAYLAIHSVIVKGYWNDDGEWVETANETGWGANCGGKYGDGGWEWDGGWHKKWGGWVSPYGDDDLPLFTPFDRSVGATHPYGNMAYWRIELSPDGDYPFPPYDANGNPWPGWCTDPTGYRNNQLNRLISCYDPLLVGTPAQSNHWDLISWIINEMNNGDGTKWYHRGSGSFNYAKVQRAIWYFKFGDGTPSGAHPSPMPDGYNMEGYTANNTDVRALINDAKANGENYYPGPGEYYAVVLIPVDGDGELRFYWSQVNIIEVDP